MQKNCSPNWKSNAVKRKKTAQVRTKLQDAATAGKSKAQAKAKGAVKELEELLDALKDRCRNPQLHFPTQKTLKKA